MKSYNCLKSLVFFLLTLILSASMLDIYLCKSRINIGNMKQNNSNLLKREFNHLENNYSEKGEKIGIKTENKEIEGASHIEKETNKKLRKESKGKEVQNNNNEKSKIEQLESSTPNSQVKEQITEPSLPNKEKENSLKHKPNIPEITKEKKNIESLNKVIKPESQKEASIHESNKTTAKTESYKVSGQTESNNKEVDKSKSFNRDAEKSKYSNQKLDKTVSLNKEVDKPELSNKALPKQESPNKIFEKSVSLKKELDKAESMNKILEKPESHKISGQKEEKIMNHVLDSSNSINVKSMNIVNKYESEQVERSVSSTVKPHLNVNENESHQVDRSNYPSVTTTINMVPPNKIHQLDKSNSASHISHPNMIAAKNEAKLQNNLIPNSKLPIKESIINYKPAQIVPSLSTIRKENNSRSEYNVINGKRHETPSFISPIIQKSPVGIISPSSNINYSYYSDPRVNVLQNIDNHGYGNNLIRSDKNLIPTPFALNEYGAIIAHSPEGSTIQMVSHIPQIQSINFLDLEDKNDHVEINNEEKDSVFHNFLSASTDY